MKQFHTHQLTRVWFAGLLLLLLPGCATMNNTPEVPGTLNVHVNVPPQWNMFWNDRVTMAFVDVTRDVFHNQGFDRPVEEEWYFEDIERAPYLLTINLHEWRIDRLGQVECTFTADLRTPAGTKNLGVYTQTEMWGYHGPGRFGLAQSFERAADGALRELAEDVARSELLPGFRLAA
jgi:hypothetical protein